MRHCGGWLVIAALVLSGPVAAQAQTPTVAFDEAELRFGGVLLPDAAAIVTPAQPVFLERIGAGTPECRAVASAPWVEVVPERFSAPARLSIGIKSAAVPASSGAYDAEIAVVCEPVEPVEPSILHVRLDARFGEGEPPIGAWDGPAGLILLGAQTVRLNGWALDDLAVTEVLACADPPNAMSTCASDPVPFGYARFEWGSRPDLSQAYEAMPLSARAGWSYVLDREALREWTGTTRLSMIARDIEGHTAVLGTRLVTIETATPTRPTLSLEDLAPIRGLFLAGLLFVAVHVGVRRRIGPRIVVSGSSRTAESPPKGGHYGWFVLVPVVAFVGLNVGRLTRGFDYDELYTASQAVVGFSLWETATTVVVFNNHIGYSLAAGLATRLFGDAEWVLRLPAFLCGALAVYATWRLGRLVADRAAALLGAGLLGLSPSFAEWATSARGYSALALFTLLSSYGFLVLLRRPSTATAVGHAAALILGAYVHMYGLWVLLIQYAVFLWMAVRSPGPSLHMLWRSFAVASAAIALLYSPVVLKLLAAIESRGTGAVDPAFPAQVYALVTSASTPALQFGVGLVCLIGLLRLSRLVALYLLALLLVPLVAMWWLVHSLDLFPRFFVYWLPISSLLLGGGIAGLGLWAGSWPLWRARALTVLRLVGAAVVLVWISSAWLSQRPPADTGYRELLGPASRHEGWQVFASGGDVEMFDYYLGRSMGILLAPAEVNTALREFPRVEVAYHDMPWNSPGEHAVAAMLDRRCAGERRGPVVLYRCDGP